MLRNVLWSMMSHLAESSNVLLFTNLVMATYGKHHLVHVVFKPNKISMNVALHTRVVGTFVVQCVVTCPIVVERVLTKIVASCTNI